MDTRGNITIILLTIANALALAAATVTTFDTATAILFGLGTLNALAITGWAILD